MKHYLAFFCNWHMASFFFSLRLALFFMWELGYSYDNLLGQKPCFILLCQLIIICRYFEPVPFYSACLCTLGGESFETGDVTLAVLSSVTFTAFDFLYSFEYIRNKKSDFYWFANSTNRGRCQSTSKLNETICSFFFSLLFRAVRRKSVKP